jgi:hypothetical protein
MRRKKPDLMVVLAVMIGLGVLVTEVTYGNVLSSPAQKTTVVSR